jgi:hypothetical protein
MRLFSRLTLICTVAAIAVPSIARAGGPLGAQAFAAIDFNVFSASKTYNAVFGSSTIPGYGGGADITGIWKSLFIRVDVTRISKDGSRVFVDDTGQAFPLNEPAKLTLTPIEIGVGWRFVTKNKKTRKINPYTPYVGGGALIESYKVVYSLSPDLNESQTFTGATVFGGIDFAVTKVLFIGGEAQYRILPNALQSSLASSAAHAFGETDGGGFTGRFVIGVKFGK